MIKIPSDTKKHSISTDSDLFGTISYTKNINLDEAGYIKVSQRTVQIQSEKNDGNMELPIAFGRTNSGSTISFHMVSSEDPFDVSISATAITVTEDTASNNPNYTLDSQGKWFHNNWVSTDDNGWYGLNSGGTWDAGDTSTLTSGKAHPIEVFRSKDRVCFGNGNTVQSYSESGGTYTIDKTLTLPTDFEVIGLAYSNYKMGILTQLSDTISGQNQDAYFFTWDGSTAEAGQGIEIGSDRGLGIVAYKGSFVTLTRSGLLRFFNGGGWQDLAQLSFYFQDINFGTPYQHDLYGDLLLVDGDIIYINYNGLVSQYGSKYQQFLTGNNGGILTYDPKVGLYQRYSHSISPVSMLTVTSGNINTGTDILTKTAGTIPSTGSPIKYTSDKSNQIGGLTTSKVYYCIKLSATTFSLATTKANAVAGTAIDITGTGASNNYFLALEVYDYGVSLANNIGGIATSGTNNGICNSLIFGSQLQDFDSTSNYYSLNLVVSDFDNRGYFVTPKIPSSGLTDKGQECSIRYRPLKTNDKIIVKYKSKDLIGVPISTPQARTTGVNQCIWASDNTFYTSVGADLSDAKTAFDALPPDQELECEIIAGAGAGSMVKIADINYDSSTNVYSVFLDESVDGAASGRYCDILIDNWTVVPGGTITSSDTDGFKKMVIGKKAPWFKFKIELRGVDTTVEEFVFNNAVGEPN